MPASKQIISQRWTLHYPRALLTAIALMTTGVIVAQMVAQYVTTTEVDQGFNRSRLWWELVLNLQILSVGMIWFNYSDRISESSGPVRRMHTMNCGFALMAAIMPTFLGALSISNGWFEIRPSPDVFVNFFLFGVSFWLVGLLLQVLLSHYKKKINKQPLPRRRIGYFAPSLALAVIALIDGPRGGTLWLILMPIMLYLQGALPHFLKAFGLSGRVRSAGVST